MAKKASKPAKSNELDGKEFFTAIELIEKEKGIPKNYMLEKITQALISAYKRDHEGISDNVFVEANEITQTARQVIIQGMREAEHNMIYDLFSSKEHEMLVGTVTRIDPRNGAVSLRITSNGESTDAYLAPSEQVRSQVIREGDRLKVYVVEVRRSSRGPQVLIWKSPKSTTAPWRSAPSPGRRAAAPSWRSGPPTRTWTPSAPAWAPRAPG